MGKNPNAKSEALMKLREFPNKKIDMTLNEFAFIFNGQNSEWKTNFNEIGLTDKDKKLKELKKQNEEIDEELKNLEKVYLEKMCKILLMAHLHSETMSVINICNKYETNDDEEEA